MDFKLYDAIVLFGPPGSGKGTQGKLLHTLDTFYHVSTGQLLRDLDDRTEIGERIKEKTDKGELAPIGDVFDLLELTLEEHIIREQYKPEQQYLVLDGVPRNVDQVALVDRFADVRRNLYFSTDNEQVLFDRLAERAKAEGRVDDQDPEVHKRRFEVYKTTTSLVLKRYDSSLIRKIDRLQSIDKIHQEVLKNIPSR